MGQADLENPARTEAEQHSLGQASKKGELSFGRHLYKNKHKLSTPRKARATGQAWVARKECHNHCIIPRIAGLRCSKNSPTRLTEILCGNIKMEAPPEHQQKAPQSMMKRHSVLELTSWVLIGCSHLDQGDEGQRMSLRTHCRGMAGAKSGVHCRASACQRLRTPALVYHLHSPAASISLGAETLFLYHLICRIGW